MSDSRDTRKPTAGEELFTLLERMQGEAFCADDLEDWEEHRVILRAEIILDIQKEMNRKLSAWIRRKRGERE